MELFVDGLKLLLVQIVYFLPVILLVILAFIPLISTLVTSGVFSQDFSSMSDSQSERWLDSHPELISELLLAGGFMILLLMVAIILAIIITFFSFLGVVRFARTRSISEAFNFSAILAHIRRIGWTNYIIALIAITIIGYIFSTTPEFLLVYPDYRYFHRIPCYGDTVCTVPPFFRKVFCSCLRCGEEKSPPVI